jgi:prepilin-type N-terminal cleavage/methylation domain-containing protein
LARRGAHSAEGAAGAAGARGAEAGFTILELLVVMAIIVLITGVTIYGLRRVRKTDLRNDANTLRSALAAAFDRSTATGADHRVVIDLEQQAYRIESCEGKLKLRRTSDEAHADELAKLEQQRQELLAAEAAQKASSSGIPAPAGLIPVGQSAPVACVPVKGPAGRLVRMTTNKGIRIRKVRVAHLEKPATEGKVTVHFFSPGYAERSVIEVGDENDNVYTLVVHPLTGQVQIKTGEWRGSDDHVVEDAEGKELVEE